MKAEPYMLCKKRTGLLSPADARSKAVIGKMELGECVLATVRRVRNPNLHRKFFALIHFAFENWRPNDGVPVMNVDQFRKDLTVAAGYYDEWYGVDGSYHREAKSIAWDNMGEQEFTPLYEAVVEVLERGFIPGLTPEQAERYVSEQAEGF